MGQSFIFKIMLFVINITVIGPQILLTFIITLHFVEVHLSHPSLQNFICQMSQYATSFHSVYTLYWTLSLLRLAWLKFFEIKDYIIILAIKFPSWHTLYDMIMKHTVLWNKFKKDLLPENTIELSSIQQFNWAQFDIR